MKPPVDALQVVALEGAECILWRGRPLGVLFPEYTRTRWVTWAATCRTGTGSTRGAAILAALEVLQADAEPPATVVRECARDGHRWGAVGLTVTPTLTRYFCNRCGAPRLIDAEGTGMP